MIFKLLPFSLLLDGSLCWIGIFLSLFFSVGNLRHSLHPEPRLLLCRLGLAGWPQRHRHPLLCVSSSPESLIAFICFRNRSEPSHNLFLGVHFLSCRWVVRRVWTCCCWCWFNIWGKALVIWLIHKWQRDTITGLKITRTQLWNICWEFTRNTEMCLFCEWAKASYGMSRRCGILPLCAA